MTRVLLYADNAAVERRVRDAFGEERFARIVTTSRPTETAATDPESVARLLTQSMPDVIILAPPTDPAAALRISETIDESHPEITVIVVADPSPNLWEKALRAGVRDLVAHDARVVGYRSVIERALHVSDVRRSNIIDLTESARTPAGRIVTVVAPKGGAGKTTIATNLAVGFARQAHDQVAIVDLDLQFGDVAAALQLAPELSLADLAQGEAESDPAKVKLLLSHHAEGLFALCAPDDLAVADDVRVNDVAPALRALAADLRFVVVDTSAGVDSYTLAAIEVSTDVVFVGAMDVPSVRSLRKLVVTLDRLGMTDARRHVVLNRSDSRVDLKVNDVAAAIGIPISVAVPSSRSVPLSINHGCPVLVFDRRSPVVRPLQELVSLVSDEPVLAVNGSRSLFRRSLS